MKERPILFSGAMVRALLAGTKTQTRRVCKPQPIADERFVGGHYLPATARNPGQEISVEAPYVHIACPYGQPGDRLWVRETFAEGIHQMADVNHWAYAADHFGAQQRLGDRWKPSIHMPRAASRITLEITSVRVERLQGISEADARAEGVAELPGQAAEPGCWWTADLRAGASLHGRTPPGGFRLLWESINGPGSWDANPWVWVIEFRRLP